MNRKCDLINTLGQVFDNAQNHRNKNVTSQYIFCGNYTLRENMATKRIAKPPHHWYELPENLKVNKIRLHFQHMLV